MSDRHYGLFANNQHPIQLDAYNVYNKFLANLHSKQAAERAEDFSNRYDQVKSERTSMLNTAEGESLSQDDLDEIYIQVCGEQREANKMSLNTRDKKGDIADYLESRRPFGSAQ